MAMHHVSWGEPFPESCRHGALTIGNFDGVHLGHQALLAELGRQAHVIGGPGVAMTFDPPPTHFLKPSAPPAALTTLSDRLERMLVHGADHVLVLKTTPELLQKSAAEFFRHVVISRLEARTVVPGFNFAFGHNREGTVDVLVRMCHESGLVCVPVPPLEIGGQPVSSSRIRAELTRGNVKSARQLLGRPYRMSGVVAVGARRGKSLGFPTANLQEVATMKPADGVYAALTQLGGRRWASAVNIGGNPTFGETQRKVEVHLLDFSGEMYGETLKVDFLDRLRDTRLFAGPGELTEQLQADINAARRIAENER